MILAIDPGKEKCGLAVLDANGRVMERKTLARQDLLDSLPNYMSKYRLSTLVVGQGFFGKSLSKDIARLELRADILFVSEKYSTLEARKLYWKENKPKGLWKLIPASLHLPPIPVDDYAAVILGKRYLKG